MNKKRELSLLINTFYDPENIVYEEELAYLQKGISSKISLEYKNKSFEFIIEKIFNASSAKEQLLRNRVFSGFILFDDDIVEITIFHFNRGVLQIKGILSHILKESFLSDNNWLDVLFTGVGQATIELKLINKGMKRKQTEESQDIFNTDKYLNGLYNQSKEVQESMSDYNFSAPLNERRNNILIDYKKSLYDNSQNWNTNHVVEIRMILDSMWNKGLSLQNDDFLVTVKDKCSRSVKELSDYLVFLDNPKWPYTASKSTGFTFKI